MSLDRRAAQAGMVRLALAAGGDELGIMAAVEVGNRARVTLGHMPYSAYRQAARDGTLLLATAGEEIIGYALFGLTRRRVRLTHLCVDPAWRGRGVAHRLVEWISDRHAAYPGILAKCRVDYELGDMWIRLGFTPLSQRPGRSRAGHLLISWWRDHGHPDLFTRDDGNVLARAAIDLNVLRDLVDVDRTDAIESKALVADQIADRLQVVRTAALDMEINHMDVPLRSRCMARAQELPLVRADAAQVAQVKADLLAAVHAVDLGYPHTEQDRCDVAHVTDAIAAGLTVFATRDESLIRTLGPAARQYGLRILRPADVVSHVDELARADAYRPAAVLGTRYRQQLMGVGADDQLSALVNNVAGERPRDLRKTVRGLTLTACDRTGIYDPAGRLVAAVAVRRRDDMLTVPFARVTNAGVADTLARQMLFYLRHQARDAGARTIEITDRYLSAPIRRAAVVDGFHEHGHRFYAFVVDVCAPADQVEHHAVVAARRAGVPEPPPLRSDMPAVVTAELERIWWPAKVTDSGLPAYLIPIQQAFSAELLGVPEALLPRGDSLGLAREHVYYRSPGGAQLNAPARLLWYMSSGGHRNPYPSAVIACSQLDTVVTGDPRELFERFRHLGVWDETQVYGAARRGIVQALRFTNTELLDHVPLSRLRALAATHRQNGVPPQWPQRISSAMFAAVYREGRQR
jgi:GNAT superfamily N-acetyltransferase